MFLKRSAFNSSNRARVKVSEKSVPSYRASISKRASYKHKGDWTYMNILSQEVDVASFLQMSPCVGFLIGGLLYYCCGIDFWPKERPDKVANLVSNHNISEWAGAHLRLHFWLTCTYRCLSHLYLQNLKFWLSYTYKGGVGWGGVGMITYRSGARQTWA